MEKKEQVGVLNEGLTALLVEGLKGASFLMNRTENRMNTARVSLEAQLRRMETNVTTVTASMETARDHGSAELAGAVGEMEERMATNQNLSQMASNGLQSYLTLVVGEIRGNITAAEASLNEALATATVATRAETAATAALLEGRLNASTEKMTAEVADVTQETVALRRRVGEFTVFGDALKGNLTAASSWLREDIARVNDSLHDGLGKEVEGIRSNLTAAGAVLSERLDNETRLGVARSEALAARWGGNLTAMGAKMEGNMASMEARIADQHRSATGTLEEGLSSAVRSLESTAKAVQEVVAMSETRLLANLTAAAAATREELHTHTANETSLLRAALEAAETRLMAGAGTINTSLRVDMAAVAAELSAKATATRTDLGAALNGTAVRLEGAITALTTEMNTHATTSATALDAKIAREVAVAREEMGVLGAATEKNMTEMSLRMTAAVSATAAELQGGIAELGTRLDANITATTRRLDTDVAAVGTAVQASLVAAMSELRDEATATVVNGNANLSAARSALEAAGAAQKKELTELVAHDVGAAIRRFDGKYTQMSSTVTGAVTKLQTQMTTVAATLQTDMGGLESTMGETLSASVAEASANMTRLGAGLEANITTMAANLSGVVDSVRAEAVAGLAAASATIRGEINVTVAALEERFDEDTTSLDSRITAVQSITATNLAAMQVTVEGRVVNATVVLRAEAVAAEARFEGRLGATAMALHDNLTTVAARLGGTIKNVTARLEGDIADRANRLEANITALRLHAATELEASTKRVDEEIVRSKQETKEAGQQLRSDLVDMHLNASARLDESMQGVRTEVAKGARDAARRADEVEIACETKVQEARKNLTLTHHRGLAALEAAQAGSLRNATKDLTTALVGLGGKFDAHKADAEARLVAHVGEARTAITGLVEERAAAHRLELGAEMNRSAVESRQRLYGLEAQHGALAAQVAQVALNASLRSAEIEVAVVGRMEATMKNLSEKHLAAVNGAASEHVGAVESLRALAVQAAANATARQGGMITEMLGAMRSEISVKEDDVEARITKLEAGHRNTAGKMSKVVAAHEASQEAMETRVTQAVASSATAATQQLTTARREDRKTAEERHEKLHADTTAGHGKLLRRLDGVETRIALDLSGAVANVTRAHKEGAATLTAAISELKTATAARHDKAVADIKKRADALSTGLEGAVRAASERHDAHTTTVKILRSEAVKSAAAAKGNWTDALRSRDQAALKAATSAREYQTKVVAAVEARLEAKIAAAVGASRKTCDDKVGKLEGRFTEQTRVMKQQEALINQQNKMLERLQKQMENQLAQKP